MILGFCDDMGRSFCSVRRPEPPPGAHLVPASDGFAEEVTCEARGRVLASLRPARTVLPFVVHQTDVEHAMGARVRLSFSVKVF